MANSEVSSVFVRDGARYCFVKETAEKYSHRSGVYMKWGPPTERLEPGETPLEAAHRAMNEEAGITGKITGNLDPRTTPKKDGGVRRVYYFSAELTGYRGEADHPVKWLTQDEIINDPDVMKFVPGTMREMGLIT